MVAGEPDLRAQSPDGALAFLRRELQPYPGRAAAVARMVLACVITMLVVVIARIPFGFLAVLFVLTIPRGRPRETVRNGFQMVVANTAGAVAALTALTLFADQPLLYFLSVVGRLFLVFFLIRTLAPPITALGFGIILVASMVIWDRPGFTATGQVETVLWTAIGLTLATLVTMATEWSLARAPRTPAGAAATAKAAHPRSFLVGDAFSNPGHITFALKGCLAATLCYVFYSAVAWPGMAVCTVTCVLAAPVAPVGSPAQRVLTRLAGLLVGGVVFGVGSQVFVLPLADSLVGLVLPFSAACAAIAWVATANPWLSYAARPMAMGYLLTLFQTTGPSASLTLTRDRLVGVFLGIVLMWLVFDVGLPASARRVAAQPAR